MGVPQHHSMASYINLYILIFLVLAAHCQDDNDNEVEPETATGKREQLRWFPADTETDCEDQPGPEQVREGKPSKVCRTDEERFCFCGRIGLATNTSDQWRFLCGTCKISFKLDRKRIDPSKDVRVKASN